MENLTIRVQQRVDATCKVRGYTGTFFADVYGIPLSGSGKTREEAIGDFIIKHGHLFGIRNVELDKKTD